MKVENLVSLMVQAGFNFLTKFQVRMKNYRKTFREKWKTWVQWMMAKADMVQFQRSRLIYLIQYIRGHGNNDFI